MAKIIAICGKICCGKTYYANQIKEKEYIEKFRRENNNHLILAVAICYDSKTKEHNCKIEELR